MTDDRPAQMADMNYMNYSSSSGVLLVAQMRTVEDVEEIELWLSVARKMVVDIFAPAQAERVAKEKAKTSEPEAS